jgi:hypothetical protein
MGLSYLTSRQLVLETELAIDQRPRTQYMHCLQRGVCHTVALPFTLKSILRQKKNYGNSNISPCKNIIFKKNPLKETKILQNIITL